MAGRSKSRFGSGCVAFLVGLHASWALTAASAGFSWLRTGLLRLPYPDNLLFREPCWPDRRSPVDGLSPNLEEDQGLRLSDLNKTLAFLQRPLNGRDQVLAVLGHPEDGPSTGPAGTT